jgi:hypothetical protein
MIKIINVLKNKNETYLNNSIERAASVLQKIIIAKTYFKLTNKKMPILILDSFNDKFGDENFDKKEEKKNYYYMISEAKKYFDYIIITTGKNTELDGFTRYENI